MPDPPALPLDVGPMASDARSTSPGAQHAYVQSQSHLLKATSDNPLPTAVPPPIAAVAGLLGVRHVLCLIGLPERGKPFIAQRLSKYLSFFHGAEVKLFDVNEVMDRAGGPPGSDHNAMFMFEEIKAFMNATSSAADRNMTVPRAGSGRSAPASSSSPPSPEVRPVVVREGSAEVQLAESLATHGEEELLVHPSDRRRKNVDSGKVAILFANDTFACFKEKWSGTSKERRRWASETLAKDRALGAKLIFIEVIVDRADILEANLRARERAKNGPTASRESAGPAMYEDELPDECLREFEDRARRFQRIYVSMQEEDGSEDDLSYIKLINYGDKVVTNRMHGYLRMRIAQFLSVIHPTPHVIYLSRHGQSEYNVLGKLGGNPPLSPAGQEYARRLAQWVPRHIFYQHGVLTKCRLWTSSLQRTILTATHIPHPIVPASSFDSPDGLPSPPAKRSAPLEAAATPLAASRVGLSSPPRRGSHETDAATPSGGTPSHRFRSRQRSRQLPPRYLQGDEGVLNEPVWEQMSPRVYRNLDEIFAGEYEGMTYEEIKKIAPSEATLRSMDKIGYRYPRGESYFDILARLDPLVHELESYHEPLLLVSHQAVLRLLYSYLMGKPRHQAPKVEIPLHTVIRITYDGWNPPYEERFVLGPTAKGIRNDGTIDEGVLEDGQTNL